MFKGTEKQVKFAKDVFEKTVGRVLRGLEAIIKEKKFRSEEARELAIERLAETKGALTGLDAGAFIGKWKWYLDAPYIRVVNDTQDWLAETTKVKISGRVWLTLMEKNYGDI